MSAEISDRTQSCLPGVHPEPDTIAHDVPVTVQLIALPDCRTLPVFTPGGP